MIGSIEPSNAIFDEHGGTQIIGIAVDKNYGALTVEAVDERKNEQCANIHRARQLANWQERC